MAQKKFTKYKPGAVLLADRFAGTLQPKKIVHRDSVAEYTGISRLNELISTQLKSVNQKEISENAVVESKYSHLLDAPCYDYSIPPRVPYSEEYEEEYNLIESVAFNRWKSVQRAPIFERNLEVWRQFWIACERADTIAQIVDARSPGKFINPDIFHIYPTKKHIILCNKSDLCKNSEFLINLNVPFVKYSAKNKVFEYPLTGTVALVGYPNVGKSSTINMILDKKKVRVSSTPGKTRSIQTIQTPQFTLLDCPGLIFPHHPKIDLVLMGVLNVDHIPDISKYCRDIIACLEPELVRSAYKLRTQSDDVLEDMSAEKGWTKTKCLKVLVKNYVAGVFSD